MRKAGAVRDLLRGRWTLRHAHVGRRPRVRGARLEVRIRRGAVLAIGDRFLFKGPVPGELVAGPGATLQIGDDCLLNSGARVFARQEVRIGDHCKIAPYATITDTNFHEVTPDEPVRVRPVVIGRNVWIGEKATILPGVYIGDDAVVGAGAVVTRSVPPRTTVAGNPARPVREFECAEGWVRS